MTTNAHDRLPWPWNVPCDARLSKGKNATTGASTITRLLRRNEEIRAAVSEGLPLDQGAAPFNENTTQGLLCALTACLGEIDAMFEALQEDPTRRMRP